MDFSDESAKKVLSLNEKHPTPSNDIPIPTIMENFGKSQAGVSDRHSPNSSDLQDPFSLSNDPQSCPTAPTTAFRSDFTSELSEMDSGTVQMLDDLKTSEPLMLTAADVSGLVSMSSSLVGDESTLGSTFGQSQSIKLGMPEDDSRSSFDSFKAPLVPLSEASLLMLPPEEDSQSSVKAQTPTPGSIGRDTVATEEDSQSSFTSQRSSKRRCLEVSVDEHSLHAFTADNLFEYQWPPGGVGGGEYFILQEQISEYLGIKSFKRKYPDLQRRQVDMDEKEFLKERGVVTETQCDLGLTALRSEEVIDLMVRDYFDKYQEYERILHEKEKQSISAKYRGYSAPNVEKSKMAEFVKKSVRSAAEWNSNLNRERQEERLACFDLQSNLVHYPIGKGYKIDKEATKVGLYPVALIPGQFQEYYRKFTPTELRFLPLNTVLYGPRPIRNSEIGSDSPSDSDDSSSSDGSSSGSTRDGSGDSSTGGENTANSQSDTPSATTKLSTPVAASSASKDPKTPASAKKTPGRKKKLTPSVKAKGESVIDGQPCRVCRQGKERLNKSGQSEDMIQCSLCRSAGHVSCLDFKPDVVAVIRTYAWQCMDCKKCMLCLDPNDEAKMMFCEKCDRGYHTFCVGLRNIPRGPWVCVSCGKCALCGAVRPGPEGATKAQWHHEYVKRSGGKKILKRTLCLACVSTPGNKSRVQLTIADPSEPSTSGTASVAKVKPIRLQMRPRVKKVK